MGTYIHTHTNTHTHTHSQCQRRHCIPPTLCSEDGSTHTESNKLSCKVKHRARPNLSSRQRPKRAPIRRRSRRRQRRGEPHTEHGLGVLLSLLRVRSVSPRRARRHVRVSGAGQAGGDAAQARAAAAGAAHPLQPCGGGARTRLAGQDGGAHVRAEAGKRRLRN